MIKLGKSGVLPALLSAARVLAPRAVWEEAVEEGKRGMYEDAFILERLLRKGGARVVGHEVGEEAEKLSRGLGESFGAGERAALAVFYAEGADAILTDDRVFLGLLAGADPPVSALVPTAAISALAEGGYITIEEAIEALGELEYSVRADAAAMEDLEAMRKMEGGQR